MGGNSFNPPDISTKIGLIISLSVSIYHSSESFPDQQDWYIEKLIWKHRASGSKILPHLPQPWPIQLTLLGERKGNFRVLQIIRAEIDNLGFCFVLFFKEYSKRKIAVVGPEWFQNPAGNMVSISWLGFNSTTWECFSAAFGCIFLPLVHFCESFFYFFFLNWNYLKIFMRFFWMFWGLIH